MSDPRRLALPIPRVTVFCEGFVTVCGLEAILFPEGGQKTRFAMVFVDSAGGIFPIRPELEGIV